MGILFMGQNSSLKKNRHLDDALSIKYSYIIIILFIKKGLSMHIYGLVKEVGW